jgi:hypothetical protein
MREQHLAARHRLAGIQGVAIVILPIKICVVIQVLYLRRFKKLDALNLKGNPIYQSEDYGIYVTAVLKKLRYFDYILVDQNMVSLVVVHYN